MKKRILSLIITLIMIVGSSVTAFAEDFEGSTKWLASFDGDDIVSNFSSEQMADDMVNVQPGDNIKFWVEIENKYSGDTHWYMTNEVLKTLEESNNSAEGGAYTYILTYTDKDGKETILYSSEIVGGEDGNSPEGEGLHQATNHLEDYFFVDTLKYNESGSVSLYVEVEGETTGLDYQETLGRLKMNFAVEKAEGGRLAETVKTGDTAKLVALSAAFLISGLVLLVAAMNSVRNRRNQKGV